MNYIEQKKIIEEYLKAQSLLLPSQKILKILLQLLSNSKRYIDYCSELKKIFENDIGTISLAEFFFLDCTVVFYEQSILKLSLILDSRSKTICLEKFFNVLHSSDLKKNKKDSIVLQKKIDSDRKCLKSIRDDFKDFKQKRDKEIAHCDLDNIKEVFKTQLDSYSLLDIQSRVFNIIESYFELLNLPKPININDYKSIGLITGLDLLTSVSSRGLEELDFSNNERIQKIIQSIAIFNEILRHDENKPL